MSNLPWSVGELPADHPSRQMPKSEPKPEGRQPLPPILKDRTPVEDSRGRIQQVTYIGGVEEPDSKRLQWLKVQEENETLQLPQTSVPSKKKKRRKRKRGCQHEPRWRWRTFKNGTRHVEEYCGKCGRHLKFVDKGRYGALASGKVKVVQKPHPQAKGYRDVPEQYVATTCVSVRPTLKLVRPEERC